MIWFLEGQSSQRDILIGAREALPADVKIFASHRRDRPEITGQPMSVFKSRWTAKNALNG